MSPPPTLTSSAPMCSCPPLISLRLRALPPSHLTRTTLQLRPPLSLSPPQLKPLPLPLRLPPPAAASRSPDAPPPSASDGGGGGEGPSNALDFLDLKRELEEAEKEDLALPGVSGRDFSDEDEEDDGVERRRVVRRLSASGRQMVRRSTLLAKQVISVRSACSLGFVSQIWIDTAAWLVAVVEVRPSILAGENEKFLLEDISQVGDVILIEDEIVAEYEVNMVGLDTLVGYNVVTVDRYNVGKVRDYNFNINSGAVESLELDPFGISIIPSTLVSTYSLLVEDILQIKSDKIVVHDDAVSRMQRLSKGFWDTRSPRYPGGEIEEFPAFQGRNILDPGSRRRPVRRRKVRPKLRHVEDDWDLPMEY